jgi:hypothetical protein
MELPRLPEKVRLDELGIDRSVFVSNLGARSEKLLLVFREVIMRELNEFLAKMSRIGIANILQNSPSTFTIVLENDSSYTVNLYRGPAGSTPELRKDVDGNLQWKYIDEPETEWTTIIDIESYIQDIINSISSDIQKAAVWAEGSDLEVAELGGTKSAKGWSEAGSIVQFGSKYSALDAGIAGEMSVDDDFIYMCVHTGEAGSARWKRSPLKQI